MAHVQIRMTRDEAQLLVDGTDITKHVLADSVSVTVGDLVGRPSLVNLTLVADALDVDLEVAEVEAERLAEPRKLCEENV